MVELCALPRADSKRSHHINVKSLNETGARPEADQGVVAATPVTTSGPASRPSPTAAKSGRYGSYRPVWTCATQKVREQLMTSGNAAALAPPFRPQRRFKIPRAVDLRAPRHPAVCKQMGQMQCPTRRLIRFEMHFAKFWAPVPWLLEASIVLAGCAAQIYRGRSHCGSAGFQRSIGLLPGGSRPSYPHCLEIASCPECFRTP